MTVAATTAIKPLGLLKWKAKLLGLVESLTYKDTVKIQRFVLAAEYNRILLD